MRLFGIELIGLSAENGRKLLVSLALVVGAWFARRLLWEGTRALLRGDRLARARFWLRQA